MFKKVETTVESTSGEQETSQLTTNSGDVKTKPEKPKRKFVASLKSNIRQLGSSVVGLKMSKQQKPGSFTDSTQSSELKKKKNKKQKEELGPSLSTDSEQSVGAKPKASKVAANLVKKLSVDKIYQPFIGQQYTGSNVKTSVTSSSTGPTPPESDVKSTSSSEISYESPIHAPKDRLEEVKTKEQTTAGSTTAEVGKDETTKPVILEDLILQTQQFAESLASPDKPGKNLLAEFIEAESKNNSKKSEDKITNKDVKSQIETKLSEKNDNKIKDQDHKNKTVNLSRDESKDSKSEKLQEENKKKSDKQEKIIESDKERKAKERKAKEDQDKVDSKGDKTDPPAQVERKPQKKDESKVSVKTNPSSKPEVDLNIEKNSTKSDTEKHQMPASGDKLKQQKFAEHEKQSVIKETEENMNANKQNKLTLDGNKSEKRKSVQDGDEKETKHIKIEQDKDTEKGKTQKEKYEKEGTQNEKTGTEKDEKENTQIQKIQDKDDKKNTQNEKTVTEKGDKENTQIEKNQEKDDKENIQNEKDKIENTKTDTNIMKEEEGKPVDESVSTTSLDIKTPQSSANAVIDNTSKNLPSELVESDKVTTPTLDSTIINPLDNPSTFISGKSENTPGSSHDSTFPLPDRSSSPKETSTIMSQVPEKRECLYKILVIGELGTGKTSIIKRYVHQFFSQHYRATIGVDFALKVLNWDPNTIIRLQLWDIAGQERFGNMTRVYYKEAVGAFIVFDVTRSATFDAVLKWKQDLDAKVQLADGASIPCVLLANKCDQQKEGIINNPARMEEYCKEHNFSGWFETSAKENINIDEAAKSLVTQILQNDKVSQNGRDIRDGSKFPLDGKGEQQESKSCSC